MTQGAKSDRWNLIEEIFQNAVERPESERSNYLKKACEGDEGLRSEVESLLASDSGANTVQNLIAGDIKDLEQASSSSETGQQVGPYRLIRELDSGGMGAVYLGVRSDDQYFQIVAVKMIRKGMESPAHIQRFRAERQILATLKHPDIGAILDGGETDDGRPYIVMEYVEGQPITQASESRGLVIRQRVELFRSLCSAIHYAHQKLIIHRDIKPNNVLVTAEGIVKLIDFGISKPLAPEILYGEMPQTDTSQRLLTPDYASPEQILGKNLTTASDIYSLGVLLFELLTGSQPYRLRELSAAAAERLVCEQESRKPSKVPGLSRQIKKDLVGDLDRIILMAMDPDPSRRYQSAQHFEEDLVRYLHGKPIAARKATTLYRLRKFVYRHKTAAVMTCATIVVVVCAILFDSWQSRRAARKVNQIETLADSTISDMTEKLQNSSASVETQAALFHAELQYLDQLRQSSGNEPHVLLKLVKAYERVGDLEGSPFGANLGDEEAALHSYQKALGAATEAHSRLPGDESTRALIEVYQRLARMEYSSETLKTLQKAADHFQQSLPLAQAFWQQNPADPIRIGLLSANYSGLALVEEINREPDKALKNLRAALQILGSDLNGDEEHDLTLARLHYFIGRTLSELGVQGEALVNLRRSVTIAEALVQKSPQSKQAKRRLYFAYHYTVKSLGGEEMLNVGDFNQDQAVARKALAVAEEMTASDSKDEDARSILGFAYSGMGDAFRLTQPEMAGEWYRKSILLAKELTPPSEAEHRIATLEESLAAVLVKKEQGAERLHLLQDANTLRQKLASTEPDLPMHRQNMMRSYCRLSEEELAMNDLAKARQYADLSLPLLNTFPLTSPDLRILRDVGLCYESLGDVQRHIATDHAFSSAVRQTATATASQWYMKSASVWNEWKRRGAATPESERERLKVEHLLATTYQNDRNSLPVAQ